MENIVDRDGTTLSEPTINRMESTNNTQKSELPALRMHHNTRHNRDNIEPWCDNGVGNKNGPASATNTKQGLATSLDHFHTDKEGLSVMLPENSDWIETKDVAITFLEFAARDHKYAEHVLANAQKMRVYYATKAKQQGLTNKAIGDIYGITESAVRAMLKNAGELA